MRRLDWSASADRPREGVRDALRRGFDPAALLAAAPAIVRGLSWSGAPRWFVASWRQIIASGGDESACVGALQDSARYLGGRGPAWVLPGPPSPVPVGWAPEPIGTLPPHLVEHWAGGRVDGTEIMRRIPWTTEQWGMWWLRQRAARGACRRFVVAARRPILDTPDAWGQRAAGTDVRGADGLYPSEKQHVIRPGNCGVRACPACARSRLGDAVERYVLLWAAPLKPGFVREFFTVGSPCNLITLDTDGDTDGRLIEEARREFSAWRASVARSQAIMVAGFAELGIPPQSWVGGLTVIELVPREFGCYAHAHVLAVRRAHYPYGYSRAHWERLGVKPTKGGRYTLARVLKTTGWPEKQALAGLGMRELLRRKGAGEVTDHEIVSEAGAAGVAGYLGKVAKYTGKVQHAEHEALFYGRPDLLALVKGQRRLATWGALRGLLGGRERARWEVDGIEEVRTRVPLTDRVWRSADGVDPGSRVGVLPLREDTLAAWEPWADLDAVRALLSSYGGTGPSALTGGAGRGVVTLGLGRRRRRHLLGEVGLRVDHLRRLAGRRDAVRDRGARNRRGKPDSARKLDPEGDLLGADVDPERGAHEELERVNERDHGLCVELYPGAHGGHVEPQTGRVRRSLPENADHVVGLDVVEPVEHESPDALKDAFELRKLDLGRLRRRRVVGRRLVARVMMADADCGE